MRHPSRRRLGLSFGAGLAGAALIAGTALAALTFHSGPTVTFNGDSASATANISGLGNVPAEAQLFINGFALYTCTNKGGNQAPGQNPQPATGASPVQPLGNSDHNGRATVNVTGTLTAPQTIPAKQAGCPGSNWTANLSSLTVTSATLVIRQGGTQIYCRTFTPGGPAEGTAC